MLETHPDHGGDVEDFKKVREAFLILSDESARISYDMEEPKAIVSVCVASDDLEENDAAVENTLCWWKEPWTIVTKSDYELLESWVDMLMRAAYEFHWQGDIKVGLISKQNYSTENNMALIKIGLQPSKAMAYTYILWRMTHA